jgi:hypothetical protein
LTPMTAGVGRTGNVSAVSGKFSTCCQSGGTMRPSAPGTAGVYSRVPLAAQTAPSLQDPTRIRPDYDVGDHLHLNPAGYGAIAAAVGLSLLR